MDKYEEIIEEIIKEIKKTKKKSKEYEFYISFDYNFDENFMKIMSTVINNLNISEFIENSTRYVIFKYENLYYVIKYGKVPHREVYICYIETYNDFEIAKSNTYIENESDYDE